MTEDHISPVAPMDMKKALEDRMQQLGYTQYKLTKQICQMRAEGDEIPPVTRYNSTVGKALDNPLHVKYYIIQDLIKAMDGEIVIRWNNPDEVKLD